jgi:hypothetical protein
MPAINAKNEVTKPVLSAKNSVQRESIRSITEIEEILPYIRAEKLCGPCTLVAFDIDETLVWATKPEARSQWFNEQMDAYKAKGLSSEEALRYFFTAHLSAHATSNMFTVDKDTNNLFAQLAQQQIHVIGLTARDPMMSPITKEQFKKAKLQFPTPVPRWNEILVLDGPKKPIMAINGIIYSSGQDKGVALGLVLDKLSYRPSLLIFVDDMRYNIENVERLANERNIPFIGFHLQKYEESIQPLLKQGMAVQTVAKAAGSIPTA